ncbi:MAG: hypothetical protein K5Q68_21120 [Roseococcus sp.]|nr:hypothetical protein [Roseococcus sp.]
MTHPKELPPVTLTADKIAIIRGKGHFYAATKEQGMKVLLGDPASHGGTGQVGWTKPTYYAHGYLAIFNTQGARWEIEEKFFDPNTGEQIGGIRTRYVSTLESDAARNPTNLVDRNPGTYISIRNPHPDQVLIDADKDFGGGES